MTASLQDVFDAIYEGQGWMCVSWLYSKIAVPDIKRSTIRQAWAEHNDVAGPIHVPIVGHGENVIVG
jgi:hypothetical protein